MATTGIIGLLSGILALILNIVGLAIPYWLQYNCYKCVSSTEVKIDIGLWKVCADIVTADVHEIKCGTLQELNYIIDFPSEAYVSRALEILAVLFTAAALVVAFVKVSVKNGSRSVMMTAGLIVLLTGLFTTAGGAGFVMSDNIRHASFGDELQGMIIPHAGFALCVASGAFCIAAAILFFFDTVEEKKVKSKKSLCF